TFRRSSVLINVAVPVPLLGLLTYAVPDGLAAPPVGARVVVPLGSRIVTGIVVSTDVPAPATSGPGGVKAVRDVLDRDAFGPPDVVGLARWTAENCAAGVGDAIPMLLPPMARGGRVDAHKTRRVVSITASGMDALDAVTAKQREVLALLSAAPDGVAAAELAGRGFAA